MKIKLYKKISRSRLAHRVLAAVVRLYSRTITLECHNEGPWMDHVQSGGKVVLGFWHQHIVGTLGYHRNLAPYKPLIMISASSDGALIGGIARHLSVQVVHGSSSKGGRAALMEMVRKLRSSAVVCHVLDGPRGPAGNIKAGVVLIAQTTGAAIYPTHFKAENFWQVNSWDKHIIPKPFSRVIIRFGNPISYPRRFADKAEMGRFLESMEGIIKPDLAGFDFSAADRNTPD